MENFAQFLGGTAPFILVVSCIVLGAMLFFEERNSKKLEQENEMTKFLVKQLNEEMRKLQGNTIHIEIDMKGFSTICLTKHDGVNPSKDMLSIRAVFTKHLGIKLTP